MKIKDNIIFSLKKIQENTEIFAPNIDEELTLSQVHCISVIGDSEGANVTEISNKLEMTTGAITKMCKKLFSQGFVEKYQEDGNKQKIYYRLTNAGQKIYKIHKKLHDKIQKDKESVIDKYSEDEKVTILRFLDDINTMMSNMVRDFKKDGSDY